MDGSGPSRRRCREVVPCNARNVRPKGPVPGLVASRRRRREETAVATSIVRAGPAPVRNVRPRLLLPRIHLSGMAAPSFPSAHVTAAQTRRRVLSEFPSGACGFAYVSSCRVSVIPVIIFIFRRSFLSTCACNHRSR